ncbi:MAG: AAA domain-containing protein [Planctomycetaceae bacterium]
MSDAAPDARRQCVRKVRKVFEYLKELNQHRSPAVTMIQAQPWSMWLDEMPEHPTIRVGFVPDPIKGTTTENESLPGDGKVAQSEPILQVKRPRITHAPKPPSEIAEWLVAGWNDPQTEASGVRWHESINDVNEGGETVVRRFEDQPIRESKLKEWLASREEWRRAEIPARAAMAIYERLYELRGQLARESERFDLVIGDGILGWATEGQTVFHPILISRVQLEFDHAVPQFTIVDGDQPTELYTALFHSIGNVSPENLARCRGELEDGGYHPLAESASGFLRQFAVTIHAQGEFVGSARPTSHSDVPKVGRAPVLFLRNRTLGFSKAIEGVLRRCDEIERQPSVSISEALPPGLLNVVGCETESANEPTDEATNGIAEHLPTEDILFGKEANPEQVRIARRLNRFGAVLVQGPPGTGKSHTIANLIGHLLAKNKSVLVTSHTTKALRVLRNHVVPELRPLCVSVLESDLDSRKQLEDAVQEISNRLSTADADSLEVEARNLESERRQLIAKLNELQGRLLEARADEYREIVFGGKTCTPADAARKVAAGIGTHDWIPGPVKVGVPLPLAAEEVRDLYTTNGLTTLEDDRLVQVVLPSVDDVLLTPEKFAEQCQQLDDLSNHAGQGDAKFWKQQSFTRQQIVQLDKLADRFTRISAEMRAFPKWELAIVEAGRESNAKSNAWTELIQLIQDVRKIADDSSVLLSTHRPSIKSQVPLDTQIQILSKICEHLKQGGRLSWWSLWRETGWKQLLPDLECRGGGATDLAHFEALLAFARLVAGRNELSARWKVLAERCGLPLAEGFGEEIERVCEQYIGRFEQCLNFFPTQWQPLIEELSHLGFQWDDFLSRRPVHAGEFGSLLRICDAIEPLVVKVSACSRRLRFVDGRNRLRDVSENLKRFDLPIIGELRAAIEQRQSPHYDDAYQSLVSMHERRRHAFRRRDLLKKLVDSNRKSEAVAERWANAIRERSGIHGKEAAPGDPLLAWEWRQLYDEINRRSQTDLDALGRQIEEIQRQIRQCTVQLIDRRAWAAQIRRITLRQRMALLGWVGLIRKIGRGTGKYAPKLRVEAATKMGECRDAVPVWIMPLARVVENFDFEKPQFDVVIIDEASQCDVMALLAVALGRKVIVVGDHEQVSPSAVGQKLDMVHKLIAQHLDGIPNSNLYDGQMSVYDLARMSFGGLICLQEHFRCVSDIIQFSNHLCYNGTIKPLRDSTTSRLLPHVVHYRVESHTRSDNVNRDEAEAVASLIAAAMEHEAYRGQTFGVVSLLGVEQAIAIGELLWRHVGAKEHEERHILFGNAAQFQGDERDVMFLSLVDVPSDGPLAMRSQDNMKQRFNVAASRARNQMWVVHSLNPEVDLKPGDLRRRLIEHSLNPAAIDDAIRKAVVRAESEFERQVCRRLIEAGYCVTPQWNVGGYRIDMIVEGDGRRLAVECDGDRYHPPEKLPDDMARQMILERLGWTFVRIRGTQFLLDPDKALEPVFRKLAELEIPPLGTTSDAISEEARASDDVVAWVSRRSAEIRLQWARETAEGSTEFGESEIDSPGSTEVRSGVAASVGTDMNESRSPQILPAETSSESSTSKPRHSTKATGHANALKEVWQLTLAAWREQRDRLRIAKDEDGLRAIGGLGTDFAHRYRVEQALKEGKPVPKEVLDDYPDLLTENERNQRELCEEQN